MKLEWKYSQTQTMSWSDALKLEESLKSQSWRLPTRGELIDAYDSKIEGFQKDYYWTSSNYDTDTNSAWNVYLDDGNSYYTDKSKNLYVRLCRDVG
jgi:hypothetical protein